MKDCEVSRPGCCWRSGCRTGLSARSHSRQNWCWHTDADWSDMVALLDSRSGRHEEEAGWPLRSRESTLVIRFTSEEPGLHGPGFVPSAHSRCLQFSTRWQFESGEESRQCVEDVCRAKEAVLAELRVSGAFRSRRPRWSAGIGPRQLESRWWAEMREEEC